MYIEIMAGLIKDCSLDQMSYSHFSFTYIMGESCFLESHMDLIVSSLNIKKLAGEMEIAAPRQWGKLLDIFTKCRLPNE